MFAKSLDRECEKKSSFLCVGLDPNYESLKASGFGGSLFDYNKLIIDATAKFAIAFKPQVAYYSAYGKEDELIQTVQYIREKHPMIPIILDAKRGDIGSTADMYAKESYEKFGVDAVTVNPYMGSDCVAPFLKYENKGVILLARTSNDGAKLQDFDLDGKPLYRHFIDGIVETTGLSPNLAFVVGATCKGALREMSTEYKENWFLVPGVGAQGAKVADVLQNINRESPRVLINVSRGLAKYDANERVITKFAFQNAKALSEEMKTHF
jgi:orotidine-5'-phosphate decarboxylase